MVNLCILSTKMRKFLDKRKKDFIILNSIIIPTSVELIHQSQ